jgi:D-3-phosphoglycerate dehydrogenase
MPKPLDKCRVLVTPTSYGKNDPNLRSQLEALVGEVIYNTTGRPLTDKELVRMIPGIDGYIAGLDEINRNVIQTTDQLRVIARYGVGVDGVDLEAAKEKGIVVTNTPGANSASVAELTIGLMISLARNIPFANQTTKAGDWLRLGGLLLEGKVVGLLGFGAIGQRVAKLLKGFECKILAYDPIADTAMASKLSVELLPQTDLVQQADFLSLHCPLTEETDGMVDEAFIEQMKDGANLINTARGELVDEEALYEALQNGKLTGAALDVFATQPPDADHPLLALQQVIATPHMGSHTDGAMNAMGWQAQNDCLAVLRGEQPRHQVV